MIVFYNILIALMALLIGYILGSISFSVLIGKIFFHKDPRDYGSHNAGGTNAGRIYGKKVGVIVILLDMSKAILATYITWMIIYLTDVQTVLSTIGSHVIQYYWLTPVGACLGHCFSLFLHFRGGKAVSCYAGTIVGCSYFMTVIGAILFFVTLKMRKFVSLASITASTGLFLLSVLMVGLYEGGFLEVAYLMNGLLLIPTYEMAIALFLMTIIIVLAHHANIKRLHDGDENKIKWMK